MSQILLYENGNEVGGKGTPTNASGITFDNTNTDLVAENVEDAIVEVNEKTKHGVVELWKNANISNSFAGQNIQIANVDVNKIDAVVIATEIYSTETLGAHWFEFDKDILSISGNRYLQFTEGVPSAGKLYKYIRQVSFSMSGNVLTITFADCTEYVFNTWGSAASSATNNTRMIPVRVLGIIHND